jgi:predicted Zn-dependent protease
MTSWTGALLRGCAGLPEEKPERRSSHGPRLPARWLILLAVTLAFQAIVGCVVNPVSGKRQIILMSEDDEQEIDRREAKNVEELMGIAASSELNDYVNALGQAMARNAPYRDLDYHFAVVEMDVPNAFALPGGHIYVSRGLLAISNSEAELANVLGHEIGHVAARHSAQRDVHSKAVGLASVLGQIGAAAAGGDGLTVAAVQSLGAGMVSAYGRSQEREADVFAQDLAAVTGIDPDGMAEFLRTLERTARLEQGFSRGTGYFDSHPSTPERVADATSRATLLRWSPDFAIAPDRAAYLSRLDGLSLRKPAAEGVIRDGRFLHPELRFSVAFPHSWQIYNQRSRVIATPGPRAMVMLELHGPGDDPRRAAEEYMESQDLEFSQGKVIRIGDLDAYRARSAIDTPLGSFDTEVTWIAHRGRIYRLSAGAAKGHARQYRGIFSGFSRSFRELRSGEEPLVDELRLRIAVVQPGESLEELSRRTGNVWDLNRTAVMNHLVRGQRPPEGDWIKIAVREPYIFEPEPSQLDEEERPDSE